MCIHVLCINVIYKFWCLIFGFCKLWKMNGYYEWLVGQHKSLNKLHNFQLLLHSINLARYEIIRFMKICLTKNRLRILLLLAHYFLYSIRPKNGQKIVTFRIRGILNSSNFIRHAFLKKKELDNFFTLSIHFGPSPVMVCCTLSPASSTFRYSRLQSIFMIPCSFATSNKMIAPPIVKAAKRPTLADANPVTLRRNSESQPSLLKTQSKIFWIEYKIHISPSRSSSN